MKAAVSKNIPDGRGAQKATELPFFVPLRPRFLQELVVVPCKDELIVEGTERLQAIDATLPDNIVPDLMRLMNGKRTFDELLSMLPGASAEDLLEAISCLHRWGLVEDGAADPELARSNVETLAFLRRYVGVTRSNRSGGEAYDRLRKSEVLIFNSDDALDGAACLQALLAKVGVGRVVPLRQVLLPELLPRISASVAQSMAVSVSFRGEDCEWHQHLDDWCFERRLPWLRLVLSPEQNCADLGPLFDGERTPCFRCFQQVHSMTGGSGRVLAENRLGIEAHFWMGMAAAEITYFLTRICPLATERAVERYDLNQQTSRRLGLLRVPGCLRCRPPARLQGTGERAENVTGEMDSAAVFEDYVALPSRPRIPFTVQQDYLLISSALAKQAKRMPNCTHVPLRRTLSGLERPALEIFSEPVVDQSHTITTDGLSTMLMTTAGLRDVEPGAQEVQRWTATAGNLGSVELFLAVRHVEGLTPGLYFYESSQHRLAFFQQRGGEACGITEFMQRAAVFDRPDLPDVLVLFTGAYHRLEKKYQEFGYKLVNLDAGVAVSQLHFVAKGVGVFSSTALRWADDLIEQQLNLDAYDEQVTSVVALYAKSSTARATTHRPSGSIPGAGHAVPARRLADFGEIELRQVTEQLYRESRMSEPDLHLIPSNGSIACPAATLSTSPPLRLPPPKLHGELNAADILAQRTTVRNYIMDPVLPDQLASMLDCAWRGDREMWREEHLAHPLKFYVLAWNLARFQPGVYAYDAENHGLQVVAPVRSYHDSMNLFVQPEFASAAVVVWIAGNLRAACARLGALGHRLLLLRAGSAGHRLWSAALAMGLSGGVTAGLVNGAAREQFGLDGYEQVGLLGFATGTKNAHVQDGTGIPLDGEPG